MPDPYRIPEPAVISFSGGRTSAYMLSKIVDSYEGELPRDIVVAFANTGKERPETLRFVQECGERFGVRIHWLEWRDRETQFEEVGPNSCSRNGEPFEALIRKKQRLPNWQERWCTEFLKVRPLFALAKWFGWEPGHYSEVIGLRNDEGHRILRGLDRAATDGRRVLYPLAKAKVDKAKVMEFWARQDFDLRLRPYEGNCDFCFLKGRGIRKRIIRDGLAKPDWWIQQEVEQKGLFDRRDTMADLVEECRRSPELFDEPDDFEYDAECGLTCGGDHG